MTRIGIIGGGPGGLITAYRLSQQHGTRLAITLFEADAAVGGKLQTRTFDAAPVPYEAGAAECYDYSALGEDRLRTLVDELGLVTSSMVGGAVVLDDTILANEVDYFRAGRPRRQAFEALVLALPHTLRRAAPHRILQGRVHRWCGAVSGQPRGIPLCDPDPAHQLDRQQHPGLFVVGDYLFDSTLNGVCRSAELAAAQLSSYLLETSAPSRPQVVVTRGGYTWAW